MKILPSRRQALRLITNSRWQTPWGRSSQHLCAIFGIFKVPYINGRVTDAKPSGFNKILRQNECLILIGRQWPAKIEISKLKEIYIWFPEDFNFHQKPLCSQSVCRHHFTISWTVWRSEGRKFGSHLRWKTSAICAWISSHSPWRMTHPMHPSSGGQTILPRSQAQLQQLSPRRNPPQNTLSSMS